jgi:hypothetical protein
MEFSVDVPGVSFIVDAEDEDDAIMLVEDMLAGIAIDWSTPEVS